MSQVEVESEAAKVEIEPAGVVLDHGSDIDQKALRVVAQQQWLTDNSTSFETHLPDTPLNQTEASALHEVIDGAHIVALGEATPGAHEVLEMKTRLVRHLVEHEGFRILALDGSMAAAQRANEFVLEGKGTAEDALSAIGFDAWQTEELRDLLHWMRSHNEQQGDDAQRVSFHGFDMQFVDHPKQELLSTITGLEKNAPTSFDTLCNIEELIDTLPGDREIQAIWQKVWNASESDDYSNLYQRAVTESAHLYKSVGHRLRPIEQMIETLKTAPDIPEKDFAKLQQQFRLIDQALAAKGNALGNNFRDSCMDQNANSIIDQNPGVRIITWAHNYHVGAVELPSELEESNVAHPMGELMRQRHGDAYRSIGVMYFQGSHRAGAGELEAITAHEPQEDALEYYLHQHVESRGSDQYLVNLRQPREAEVDFPWPVDIRMNILGAESVPAEYDRAFRPMRPQDSFDGIMFLDRISPAKALR